MSKYQLKRGGVLLRIGVVSDSHDNLYMLDKAISAMGKIDILLHLGDYYRDILKINNKYNHIIDYVVGNNDFIGNEKSEKMLEVSGKKIFLTHGHKYNVNSGMMGLKYRGEEVGADIVLYGHTHICNVEYVYSTLFLNPGSTSKPRIGMPSAAILNIDDKGQICVEKIIVQY